MQLPFGNGVISLDAQRPHVVIPTDDKVHVLPLLVLERFAARKIALSEIEDGEDMLRTIVNEWLIDRH